MEVILEERLIIEAVQARKNAYVPYSRFKVGAAVVADNGNVYTGCNIENSSFGATICAERVAITKAVSDGAKKINAIAVCAGEKPVMPCGICRQVLAEFAASENIPVICASGDGSVAESFTLGGIMPNAFTEFAADR